MNLDDHIAQLRQFRQSLYEFFCHRRDSLMDLLDALCSEHKASSVVEVLQHLLFRRGYSGLYRAIGSAFEWEQPSGEVDGVNVQPGSMFSSTLATLSSGNPAGQTLPNFSPT